MNETKVGWHFTTDTLRNSQSIPPIGKWLKYNGKIISCKSGLHMSEHPLDAMSYGPKTTILHYVELRGKLKSHGKPTDKWVGRERRIIETHDITKLLCDFIKHYDKKNKTEFPVTISKDNILVHTILLTIQCVVYNMAIKATDNITKEVMWDTSCELIMKSIRKEFLSRIHNKFKQAC